MISKIWRDLDSDWIVLIGSGVHRWQGIWLGHASSKVLWLGDQVQSHGQITVGQEVVGILSQAKSQTELVMKKYGSRPAPILVQSDGNPPKPLLTVNFRPWRCRITRNEQNSTNRVEDRVDQNPCLKSCSNSRSDFSLRVLVRQGFWSTLSSTLFVEFCLFRVIRYPHGLKFTVSGDFGGFPSLWTKIGAHRDLYFFHSQFEIWLETL